MFEIIAHTADVRLRVTAPTLEVLFTEAVRGMYAVMRAHPGHTRVEQAVIIDDSPEITVLLVDFLNEVLRRAYTAKEMYTRVFISYLDETTVEALLFGVTPSSFEEDVKAVTYHEADVHREGDAWTTMLVFDI